MSRIMSILLSFVVAVVPLSAGKLKFVINYPTEQDGNILEGRVLLMLAKSDESEPRFQITYQNHTGLIYGVDALGKKPKGGVVIDGTVFGYPIESLDNIPAGEYWVQGLLHTYETFNLKTGHTVKLPMDNGEGQKWNRSPGNLYSTPKKIFLDPDKKKYVKITLDQVIPPIEPPEDTKYIKHIQMQSKLLTEFWGRPMYLGAHVLLPEGFDEHPEAKYPLMIFHGHYPHDFGGFRTEPPDPDLEPKYSARFDWEGYNKTVQEYDYQFYKEWTGPDFPRVLVIKIQHQNPYYDDSYAVNSANIGPYGDAITYELIPYIEEKFRGIGEGWARFLYGGSTGGWEALAAQTFYPDEYNGCFAACPDPIDFRAYCLVNIYEDENAYFKGGPFKKVETPAHRNYLGEVNATMKQMNHVELAIGTNSRSGDQWDIWQAVYSPMASDGYPKPIWDKKSGKIDKEVADYWKENYDLRYVLERDWGKIGPKLKGKIHVYCGDMDNYYLNNAVYLMEEFLEGTTYPYYNGEVDYGDRAEHCWNGDQTRPNALSRLRYNQMFIPKAVERMEKTAPSGADLKSWRY
ncbi:MAG: alpha/beta hydrolase-fold protein [Candidatus Marinimicrobia bacterium]|nr:alpha/beta hydrolase-fold protein [Candidatus Neomarinimicrobiota bacterium]